MSSGSPSDEASSVEERLYRDHAELARYSSWFSSRTPRGRAGDDAGQQDGAAAHRVDTERSAAELYNSEGLVIAKGYKALLNAQKDEVWMDKGAAKDRHPPKLFLHPGSRLRRSWDVTMMLLLIYVATIMVYRACFFPVPGPDSAFFYFNRILDIFFVVDIFLNFITGYIDHAGYLECRPAYIARRYLLGWFAVDLISALPLDLLVLGVQGGDVDSIPRLWQLPRLIRLIRVLRIFEFTTNMLVQEWFIRIEVRLKLRYGYLRLWMFVLFAGLVAHWTACLFFFVAAIEDGTTWVTEYADNGFANNSFEFYIGALYFSVYTITTIGYGDVTPVSTSERVYNIVLMLMGAAIWAYLLSAFAAVMNELAVNEIHFRTLMDQLTEYANHRSLPEDLTVSIRRFLHHRRQHHRFVNETQLIDAMSTEQRAKLMRFTFLKQIEKSELLRNVPESVVTLACASMQRSSFAPNEYVFQKDRSPRGLYVITHGRARILNRNGKVLSVIQNGEVFGEEDLLFCRPRAVSCIADTFLDVAMLSREDVIESLKSAPEEYRAVRQKYAMRSWATVMGFARAQAKSRRVAAHLEKVSNMTIAPLVTRKRQAKMANHLTEYAARGDYESTRIALQAGAKPNEADYDGRTALHLAASEGHSMIVKLLITKGANPVVRDRWGNTPLSEAKRFGYDAVAAILSVEGQNPRLSPAGIGATRNDGIHDDSDYVRQLKDLIQQERAEKDAMRQELNQLREAVERTFESFGVGRALSGRSSVELHQTDWLPDAEPANGAP